MEFEDLPPARRLTWLAGPPGAGKTTFSQVCDHGFKRVVELSEMLAPLIEPAGITKGVLQANGTLVEMIRNLELRPENLERDPLLVVVGLAPKESILPVRTNETVWLLRPPIDRWREQLYKRPTANVDHPQYADYDYAELWYERFATWEERADVHKVRASWAPRRIGCLPPERVENSSDNT